MSAYQILRPICRSLPGNCNIRYYTANASGEPLIVTKKFNKITMIGLNRPSKKNAANIQLLDELSAALKNFETDDSSNVGILYGEGGNFCSGYDLDELASEELSQNLLSKKLTESYVKKPLIASISGYGIGFGFDLALWCDLRIMDDNAIIGFYGRRFGIPISEWTIRRLESCIGLTRTMDLLFTGRGISAVDAEKWGLIHSLSECGTAVGRSFSLAGCISKFPQPSLLADRAKAYSVAFDGHRNLMESIEAEREINTNIAVKNLNKGAKMYLDGMGRHGRFSTKIQED